jgi:hypothetical protein
VERQGLTTSREVTKPPGEEVRQGFGRGQTGASGGAVRVGVDAALGGPLSGEETTGGACDEVIPG